MKIENPTIKEIMLSPSVTAPLKAGTPMSVAGKIANDSTAIGIVMQPMTNLTNVESIYILVAGDVDLAEVESLYGSSLTSDALNAMTGINFFKESGTPSRPAPYSLPTATSTTLGGIKIGNGLSISSGKVSVKAATTTAYGGVKLQENVAKAAGSAPTKAEFDALIDALAAAGIITVASSEG